MNLPTLQDVLEAARRLEGRVLRTPLVSAWALGVCLKLESLQVTGSFKPRGAFNHILRNLDRCRRGVVTASSGNHGQAVAYAARRLGLPAVVVVPEDVVAVKEHSIRSWGAEVVRCGRTTAERIARATELAVTHGLHYVPPFDDPDVVAGQGTVGLELLNQFPKVRAVAVPCGGGGLVSGVAVVVKSLRPDVQVVAVEPEGAACFYESWRRGTRVRLDRVDTVADGLRAVEPGRLTWECASRYVDRFVTVSDVEIQQAVVRLFREGKVVAEPSGAAAVAYCVREPQQGAVAVVSGGNLDPSLLARWLARWD
ncbi:MAG: threonine/serine dehydratase [Armatimonadota bacterium]|nr:threonine/serine dehydratase [Armatimonadota bacterium]MDW8155618.1 threonine/serine dehydratase [Armatimonadota bacterium]